MSKHFRDDKGRLLQSNKTWKNLRPRQQEFLVCQLREGYLAAWEATGREPSPAACREIVDSLDYRGIWLPDGEAEKCLNHKKGAWRKQRLKRLAQQTQPESSQPEADDPVEVSHLESAEPLDTEARAECEAPASSIESCLPSEEGPEAIEKANDGYLAELEEHLRAEGLSEKSIRRHVSNAGVFLDYVLQEFGQPMERGRLYLASFFCDLGNGRGWATTCNAKSVAAGIKWLYACASKRGHVSKKEYKAISGELKRECKR